MTKPLMSMGSIQNYMRDSLKDHILVPISETEKVNAFCLRDPKQGRMMFTPEGIVLMGDLTPTDHGTVSMIGYGAWVRC